LLKAAAGDKGLNWSYGRGLHLPRERPAYREARPERKMMVLFIGPSAIPAMPIGSELNVTRIKKADVPLEKSDFWGGTGRQISCL
jgi:hypothetical protein